MKYVLCLLVLAATTARADDKWAQGVSQDQQDRAKALFAEGNQLFAQQAHGPALEKYRAAIAVWDHPLIRFNIALAEIRLDRVLDAADDLEAALRYGDEPFTAELYQEAMDYRRLITARVGDIEVTCDQSDVAISLDGKPWFSCPGNQRKRVLAGEHLIVGERKEFMTSSHRVVVAGGATATSRVALLPIESVVRVKYPSPRWAPYTVGAGGVAVALGGLALWFAARNQMDKFDAQLDSACGSGCSPNLNANATEQQLADERDGARLKGKVAVTLMITGGAVTVGGVVWVILNRPTRILPKLEVAPTGDGGVARATWRF